MNRRGFLGNLLAGAAAIVGAGLAAPSVVGAEASEGGGAVQWCSHHKVWEPLTVMPGNVKMLPLTGNMVPTVSDFNGISVGSPTFEAMQADCEARGCSLKLHAPDDGWQLLTHYPERVHTQANLEYRGGLGVVYERVDAWRRWLHEGA